VSCNPTPSALVFVLLSSLALPYLLCLPGVLAEPIVDLPTTCLLDVALGVFANSSFLYVPTGHKYNTVFPLDVGNLLW